MKIVDKLTPAHKRILDGTFAGFQHHGALGTLLLFVEYFGAQIDEMAAQDHPVPGGQEFVQDVRDLIERYMRIADSSIVSPAAPSLPRC